MPFCAVMLSLPAGSAKAVLVSTVSAVRSISAPSVAMLPVAAGASGVTVVVTVVVPPLVTVPVVVITEFAVSVPPASSFSTAPLSAVTSGVESVRSPPLPGWPKFSCVA
jgi:hypothetical protein